MKKYNKRKIMSLFALIFLLSSKNVVYSENIEYDIETNFEQLQDDNEYVTINSQVINDYLFKKYGKVNFKTKELKDVIDMSLNNFTQDDLYELSKFPNISQLSLKNGIISDSSFLNNLNNLSMLYIYNCQVNDLSCLKNTRLSNFDSSNCYLSNDIINCLPNSLTNLRLYKECVINNLDLLSINCPNIKDLSILYCSGVTNLDFVKKLDNLEILDALETPACTEDLLNYLNNSGVLSNLSNKDVSNNRELVNILDSIITEDMSDEEKVKNICVYIKKNMRKVLFDNSIFDNNYSTYSPLSSLMEKCKGISLSYSYLANSLFNMAGVNSFDVKNEDCTWNVVEVDNKYFYIDVYNSSPIFLIDKFNIGKYYMQDPYNVLFSDMSKLDDIGLSDDLVHNISYCNQSKSFSEKYLSNFLLDYMLALLLCVNGFIFVNVLNGKKYKKLNKN